MGRPLLRAAPHLVHAVKHRVLELAAGVLGLGQAEERGFHDLRAIDRGWGWAGGQRCLASARPHPEGAQRRGPAGIGGSGEALITLPISSLVCTIFFRICNSGREHSELMRSRRLAASANATVAHLAEAHVQRVGLFLQQRVPLGRANQARLDDGQHRDGGHHRQPAQQEGSGRVGSGINVPTGWHLALRGTPHPFDAPTAPTGSVTTCWTAGVPCATLEHLSSLTSRCKQSEVFKESDQAP